MAKEKLEEEGWLVTIVRGSSRFGESIDFFDRFDILAVAMKEPYIRFIQVKKNKRGAIPIPEERQRIADFKQYCPIGSVEIWVYKDRVKEPRIIIC